MKVTLCIYVATTLTTTTAMATPTTNMVASQYLDPLTSSPEMLSTPQNTPAWVKAWLQNLHLNSAEKTDEEIGAYLISKPVSYTHLTLPTKRIV